jgi:hypothetical protein
MEKSSKRGKIPQTDWPLIMTRYEAGETLSSIARTYNCSPPAISYIVSRNREQLAADVSAPPASERQLVKAPANGASAAAATESEPAAAPPPPTPAPAAISHLSRDSAGDARTVPAPTGDQRRKLHLSLGNGSDNAAVNGNGAHTAGNGSGMASGNGHAGEHSPAHDRPSQPSFALPRPAQPQAAGERASQRPFQGPSPFDSGRSGRDFAPSEAKPAQQPRDGDAMRRDNGTFIDQELRTRVDGDIAAFLAAFDAALAEDTQASRFGLREATDRLLRAGARTRIELERLEARVPLPPRAGAEGEQAAWRYHR